MVDFPPEHTKHFKKRFLKTIINGVIYCAQTSEESISLSCQFPLNWFVNSKRYGSKSQQVVVFFFKFACWYKVCKTANKVDLEEENSWRVYCHTVVFNTKLIKLSRQCDFGVRTENNLNISDKCLHWCNLDSGLLIKI